MCMRFTIRSRRSSPSPPSPWIHSDGRPFLFKEGSTADRRRIHAAGVVNRPNPTADTKSMAALGQVKVASDRVHRGSSCPLFSRRQDMDNVGVSEIGDRGVVVSAPRFDSGHGLDAEARSRFRIGDGAPCYVSATRGFKSGGFNPTASAGRRLRAGVGLTYEAGFKSALNQRVNRTSRRSTRTTPTQVQTPIRLGVVDITNAATATIRGVEAEGQAQPRARTENGWTRRLARRPI